MRAGAALSGLVVHTLHGVEQALGAQDHLQPTVYLATIPTGKLRMNEGTDASSRTTNMWITVYVALSGFGLASVGTFKQNVQQGHACDVRFTKKHRACDIDAAPRTIAFAELVLVRSIDTTASNISTYQNRTTQTVSS